MRPSPKSAILTSPRLLTRMFSGFRSRCSTMFVCRKSSPRSSCCITSCTHRGSSNTVLTIICFTNIALHSWRFSIFRLNIYDWTQRSGAGKPYSAFVLAKAELSSYLNTVTTQSRSSNLGQVGGQVLVDVFQHQSEVQAPAVRYCRRVQQPGHESQHQIRKHMESTTKYVRLCFLCLTILI